MSLSATIEYRGRRLRVDFSAGRSIAIPLDPHGAQARFFADRPACAEPLRSGGFIGAVRAGGSCNAETVELAPHCHGTHTEGVGHVLESTDAVQDCIDPHPCLARLLTLRPEPDAAGQPVFTLDALRGALQESESDAFGALAEALVLRSALPDPLQGRRDYDEGAPYPVLSNEAMAWLTQRPLRHLLVDAPSLDPARDGGRLLNHRLWWGLEEGTGAPADARRRSVTEMIWAPPELADGCHWLHLELSPLLGDATLSRPVLYPVAPGR